MDLPPLTFRGDLLAAGWTDREVRRMRRSGALRPVRRGAYLSAPDLSPDTAEARHALLVRATLPHLAPGWALSHVSAAVLLGLPAWGLATDRVHSRGTASAAGG